MTSEGKKIRLAEDVRFQRVLDEAVAVKQLTNEVLVINEVSASILEFCQEQGGVTVTSLIDYLASEYDIDRQVLNKDIPTHIEELLAAGIITREE